MQAPLICDYQTANYTLTIEDITFPEIQPLTRQSSYTGSKRSIVEVFTSGLLINRDYSLSISVVEDQLQVEVSTEVKFSMYTCYNFLIGILGVYTISIT